MTLIPEIINTRKILYLDIAGDLKEFQNVELKNWVLFVIEDNIHNPILWDFAGMCIDKGVLYVCATGKACSQMDDLFDFKMVERVAAADKLPTWYRSEDDVLMTSWHNDFDNGFWFVLTTANYDDWPIDTVAVINLTRQDYLERIQNLSQRIAAGWLPNE